MNTIPIKLIENHDEAYYFWKKLGLRNKPLVHLDAHIDFNFFPVKSFKQAMQEAKSKEALIRQLSTSLMYQRLNIGETSLTGIGNYIYPAMRDGIVGDFYWVIPGTRNEFAKSQKFLRAILQSFFSRDPFERRRIVEKKGMLQARIYGRIFTVTTLENLSLGLNDVIVDIDTDFLTTDTVRKAAPTQQIGRKFPWIWPDELADRLRSRRIHPCCMVIAYSVNGGFTPLVYKFLGDELMLFVNSTNNGLQDVIAAKKKAFIYFYRGKFTKAIEIAEDILKNLKHLKADRGLKNKLKAHIAFILFRCHAQCKDFAKAKSYYTMAIRMDKSYAVKDNNYGHLYTRRGNMREARQEFELILRCNKKDSHALCGLAHLYMRRKDFQKARRLFRKAYTADAQNRQALFGLSWSEFYLKNYKRVIRFLGNSVGTGGNKTTAHFLLAQAYAHLGKLDEALQEYKFMSYFGMRWNVYLNFFKLLQRTGIPLEHKAWVESRIKTYIRLRDDFFALDRNRFRKMRHTARKKIKKVIKRIDKNIPPLQRFLPREVSK